MTKNFHRYFPMVLMFFFTSGNLHAQIHYTNPSPDIVVVAPEWPSSTDSYLLDVDNDGVNDFKFDSYVAWAEYSVSVTPLNGAEVGMRVNEIDTLNLYDSIPAMLDWGNTAHHLYYIFAAEPPEGLWVNATNKFMAIRLPAGDGWNYGWIRMDVISNKVTIKDFAFEPESNKGIFAGYGMLPLAFNLFVSDISNNQNGTDLQLFTQCEIVHDFVEEYRMIAVKSEFSDVFNLDMALQLPPERYKTITPEGNSFEKSFNADSRDSDGDLITEFQEYNVFVLSIVKDTLSAPANCLSLPSNPVTLKSVVGSITSLTFDPAYKMDLTFDFHIGFNVPEDETGILEYRLMVVEFDRYDAFSMDSALQVVQENYIPLYPDGNHKSVTLNSTQVTDYSGHPIRPAEYVLFVLTVPDSVGANTGLLHHSPAVSLILAPLACQQIKVYDNGQNNNSGDLYMTFHQSDTNSVSRFMLVEQNAADTFEVSMAVSAVSAGYFDVAYEPGDYSLNFPENLTDYLGNPIVQQTGYKVFSLSLPDTLHTNVGILSQPSNVIALADPDLLKAGQTAGNGITYFDFDPDVEFMAIKETITHYFDLNLDGINDFYFYATHNSSPMFSEGETGIVPLNGNKIAIKNPDFGWAMPVDSGLMISEHLLWLGESCIFSCYFWDAMGNQYSGGFWQGGMPQFAGLRVISAGDTLFGWLRIQAGGQSVTAFDYASYDDESNRIAETTHPVSIYPNPVSNGILNVSLPDGIRLNRVQVLDMKSTVLLDLDVKDTGTKTMQINTAKLPAGVYLLTCFTDCGEFSEKIVVK